MDEKPLLYRIREYLFSVVNNVFIRSYTYELQSDKADSAFNDRSSIASVYDGTFYRQHAKSHTQTKILYELTIIL